MEKILLKMRRVSMPDLHHFSYKKLQNLLRWILYYGGAIGLMNIAYSTMPMLDFFGCEWPPVSMLAGLIFVIRDYAQNSIGNKLVFIPMGIGIMLSYALADQHVATASATAFLLSEATDYIFYTYSRMSVAKRIIISSLFSTPIDSAVFLFMLGDLNPISLSIMFASKMLGALVIGYCHREAKLQANQ